MAEERQDHVHDNLCRSLLPQTKLALNSVRDIKGKGLQTSKDDPLRAHIVHCHRRKIQPKASPGNGLGLQMSKKVDPLDDLPIRKLEAALR
jgi:hypothetical protein